MPETQRARPMEYYNPRVLILGICFCWGVAMGFCLFYFSPPKQMAGASDTPGNSLPETPRAQMTDQERRRVDEPKLADVEPAAAASARQPAFETMLIAPHMPVVTTEGGLTGRTARPLARRSGSVYSSAPAPAGGSPSGSAPGRPAAPPPPPIPELMP